MTLNTALFFSATLLMLALGVRRLCSRAWIADEDPFGRLCKKQGKVNHPEYPVLENEYPGASFMQLDVVIEDLGETTTVSVLLVNPSEKREGERLAYYTQEGVVFKLNWRCLIESVVSPWERHGYSPVAAALIRSYV